jgi:hypothetical protein
VDVVGGGALMKGFYMHGTPGGCALCGEPAIIVGVFVPESDDMRGAVLALRTAPVHGPIGVAYGVCEKQARDMSNTTEAVEAKLLDEARAIRKH